MIRLIFSALFLGILSITHIYGQDPCGTTPTTKEHQQYIKDVEQLKKIHSESRIYEDNTIRVVMYRIRKSDGSDARTDTEFAEEINKMNVMYDPFDICFSLMRIINIDDDNFALGDWGNNHETLRDSLKDEYPFINEAVTIYVLPMSLDPTIKGRAFGIPSEGFIMISNDDWWGTSLAPHEMGHCLGLVHTQETFENSSIELVTRTWGAACINGMGAWQDCNVGGDKFCDTEATFNLNFDLAFVDTATCTYIFDPLMVDCQGNAYTPQVDNLMSYAYQTCPNTFTGQQEGKMHLTLDANLIFSNRQAHENYSFFNETHTSGRKHYLAKNSITLADGGNFIANGWSQTVHEAQGFIDFKPGFQASPASNLGFYVAKAKDLCNNDETRSYTYGPYQ